MYSSAVEHYVDVVRVLGSNPNTSTLIFNLLFYSFIKNYYNDTYFKVK